MKLLELIDISKKYENGKYIENINFTVHENEIIAIVGESGSGKTTVARITLGIIKESSGKIIRHTRDIQMIFQNPYSALNPKMKVKDIILEGFRYNKKLKNRDENKYLNEIMQEVGLNSDILKKYPHELSGGQCQRVGIARVLIVEPKIIIADECFSALDMLIQKQILELFLNIKSKRKLSYIFITHDLGLVKKIADKIVVVNS